MSAKRTLIATSIFSAVAIGLLATGEGITRPIRTGIRDASLPGHRAITAVRGALVGFNERFRQRDDQQHALGSLRDELERQQTRNRQLSLENAMLNERLTVIQREGLSPYTATSGVSLVVPELIEATVMSEQAARLWRSYKLVDRGSSSGITELDVVIQSTAPVIDQGEDSHLLPDQPIYAGRTVVGKIQEVGRWTSTIEHVTDIGYRGYAQLAWQSPEGHVFGGEGILEGHGDELCKLTNVSATEAVSVGDDVYTANRGSTLPYPMYYGKVVAADLEPGALSWDILVKPAIDPIEARTVHVLTTKRNPRRPLGN